MARGLSPYITIALLELALCYSNSIELSLAVLAAD